MSSVDRKRLFWMAFLVLLALGGAVANASSEEEPHPSSHPESGEDSPLHLPKGSLPQLHAQRTLQAVQITRFALINADSNAEITTVNLDSDGIISLNALPSINLNILAIATGTGISKVVFDYNMNGVTGGKTENIAPYSLCGDAGSPPNTDYNACSRLKVGKHRITADALVGTSIAATKTVSFELVNGPVPPAPVAPAPTPVAPAPVMSVPTPVAPAPVVPPPVSLPTAPAPVAVPVAPIPVPPTPVGSGNVIVMGELRKWHKVTLAFQNGPPTSESATPNPFTNYRLDVVFTNGGITMTVPGYYAADGNAATTSATEGSVWHCHLSPPATGVWTWQAHMVQGTNVISYLPGQVQGSRFGFDGLSGSFTIEATNKTGRDLRGKGLLKYVNGKHHMQFSETGEWFLKGGADSPENFLAYDEFDNTPNYNNRRKDWAPHIQDFQNGDPTWQGQKGKGIIGAINYLSNQGANAFSFLTMNIQGDDRNVFPYVQDTDRLRIDVSKTAQWEIVLEHATKKGMYLHFKTTEKENYMLFDGGAFFGTERQLYYRELIARFGHHLALNWNLGEENGNTSDQLKAFTDWFKVLDPYQHIVVVHTPARGQGKVYNPLLGYPTFDGASIQADATVVFADTLNWVQKSKASGRTWIVANDEQGPAKVGVAPDSVDPEHNSIRTNALWGNIMAGGAGVEYYFGNSDANSDLRCEDFRSRANMWVQNKHALDFFSNNNVPFQNLNNNNAVVQSGKWCLVGKYDTQEPVLVVYLSNSTSTVNLTNVTSPTARGSILVKWYDPRNGGSLQIGSVASLQLGQGPQSLGNAPNSITKDWVVLLA